MRFSICIALVLIALLFSSCQETLEEKAERQARDYTRKCCQITIGKDARTDGIGFDTQSKVYYYYISFFNSLDDEYIVNENKDRFAQMLTQSIKDSPGQRSFLEAGFRFKYICHSGSNPKKVLVRINS